MSHGVIRRYAAWAGLFAVLSLTWLAYSPGLSGGFLFDDFINLDALGRSGPIDSWPAFWRYLSSGTADPIGRPLSLLSFLLDAHDWPADPATFLRSNLLLHLGNGVLLFTLLRQLGRAIETRRELIDPTALVATSLWLLHPLFVSTTLYAVQREAMLPATFVLLGLIAYCHGRRAYRQSGGAVGIAWMACGIGIGTLLAALCKANGLLLPLLAWVLEFTVFSDDTASPLPPVAQKRFARLKFLLLVLPSLALATYVARFLWLWSTPLLNRPWTVGQRVLTEPRILLDYLQLLAIPRSVSSGIFNDHYQAARDLWHPITTLPALLCIGGLIYLACRVRRRMRALAAALLFFFAGHLLESSTVPLELYFEHRNYLPALLLSWPLARALCAWRVAVPVRVAVFLGLVALLATTTAKRAELWGAPERLAALWMTINPESSRAQAMAAIEMISTGHAGLAVANLRPRWRRSPADLQLASAYFAAACALPSGVSVTDKRGFAIALRAARPGNGLASRWMDHAIASAANGECTGLTLLDVEAWLVVAEDPQSDGFLRGQRETLLGRVALARDLPDLALEHFNRDLSTKLRPEVAAINAARLASRGYFEQALAHLDEYELLKAKMSKPALGMPTVHAMILQRQGYWQQEMAWLRSSYKAGIAARHEPGKAK